MAITYDISVTKLFSLNGGVVRFKYNVSNLNEAIDAETQFVARNLKTKEGMPDKDVASGPDDNEFILRALKDASDTFEYSMPRHITPKDIPIVIYSDQEITVTLLESGNTSETVMRQLNELMRSFLLNFALQLWFQKCRVASAVESYTGLAILARQGIQRVSVHSCKPHRRHDLRFHSISLNQTVKPLQGKFLGSYLTTTTRDAAYANPETADIAYVEAENDYTIYNGTAWEKLADALDSAASLDAEDQEDYPDDTYVVAGKIYSIIRSGKIGEYSDRFYTGDALLCIRDNTDDDYKNTLENFIVISQS